MCLFLAIVGEKIQNPITLFTKKKKIPHADKAYILSRYSSSFIDFPRTIIDSKEALSEVQQD